MNGLGTWRSRRHRARLLSLIGEATPNACLEWQGCRHRQGYGLTYLDGKPTKAHRAAYILAFGSIPEGLDVLHRCDNPPCLNPHHLFAGTAADNFHDMMRKGRRTWCHGEAHADAKLTEADVLAIRASRDRQVDLAARFGVGQSVISAVKLRKIWRHVP